MKKEEANENQGGICFVCVIYTYFRVPEPRGRTFAELDMLFEQGVSARKFDQTEVDVFEENVEGGVMAGYKEARGKNVGGGEEGVLRGEVREVASPQGEGEAREGGVTEITEERGQRRE